MDLQLLNYLQLEKKAQKKFKSFQGAPPET